MNSSKRAKYRARAKNNRAKIEGKRQGKGKGKTTNYYFPKITETAQTFNFSDFPLKRDESYANANAETVGQNQFFKKIRWS